MFPPFYLEVLFWFHMLFGKGVNLNHFLFSYWLQTQGYLNPYQMTYCRNERQQVMWICLHMYKWNTD